MESLFLKTGAAQANLTRWFNCDLPQAALSGNPTSVSRTLSFDCGTLMKKHIADLPNALCAAGTSMRRNLSRRGTAAVETAVALPLLITLVFGAMEMANAVFLRQSLNMAAYEAAKVITRPDSNEALARTRCQEVLTVRKVSNHTLTFSPTLNTATPRGTRVTVTLSAPASNLSYGPMRFMSGQTITVNVVMVRL